MTGTPRATASSIAPVTLPASLAETRMRVVAVVHRLGDALRLNRAVFARRRAPVDLHVDAELLRQLGGGGFGAGARAERNTGFVELFAIIAITNGLPAASGAAAAPWSCPTAAARRASRG